MGRAELLSCLFFLLSFLSYSHALQSHSSNRFILLSIILAFVSMLSKEQGVTVLGVCAAYDVLKHWGSVLNMIQMLFRLGKDKFEIKGDCRALIKRLCK